MGVSDAALYDRLAARPGWAACALVLVGSALASFDGLSVPSALAYAPLAASVVVFGLPHGAVDYLVPARLGRLSLGASMAAVGALYAALGGSYAALWLVAPRPAAALFIGLTWFHWGQGDVHALRVFVGAGHLGSRPLRVATGVVRGGLPMLVPLLAFPGRYRAVVETWVGLFGVDFTVWWLFAAETRLAAGALFLALTGLVLVWGYRRGGATRAWRVDAGETALLWLFFATVSPLVAIGVYFCVWHSLRHVLRVSVVGGDATTARATLAGFTRDAAPLTAVALLFLVVFAALVPVSPTRPGEYVGLYLVFVAVLTLPHVAVVTWMDRREGVW
ncbi:MAG: Brp/Blh family beta-carotene 15,15'-dioxygenase [Halobacteriaceae archaeon]